MGCLIGFSSILLLIYTFKTNENLGWSVLGVMTAAVTWRSAMMIRQRVQNKRATVARRSIASLDSEPNS